jgi:hypothetical protein
MSLVLEIDVLSGLPNPTVELDGEEAQRVLEHVHPEARLERPPDPTPPSYLGYRGILVRGAPAYGVDLPGSFRLRGGVLLGSGLAHRPANPGAQEFLLGGDGPFRALDGGEELLGRVRDIVAGAGEDFEWPWWRFRPWPWAHPCTCGPLYEPGWWNVPARQWSNNCYNYATNYRTDTFAQPGLAAGQEYTALECANVRAAAVADELIDDPDADNRCPGHGQLVALVMAPGWDFHWYRKDRDGMWSHKPGGTPVTNLDNAGHPIADPRHADRGPYTDFCTFMIVMDGHIKIA